MTSKVKRHNLRAGDGPDDPSGSRRLHQKRNSSHTLRIATWEEEVVHGPLRELVAPTKSKMLPEQSRRRSSWEMLSTSVLAMVEDVVTGLKDEELPVEGDGEAKRKISIGTDVAARVSEIVEDDVEFHKLQEEMRATGMSTGAAAMQHIVRLD